MEKMVKKHLHKKMGLNSNFRVRLNHLKTLNPEWKNAIEIFFKDVSLHFFCFPDLNSTDPTPAEIKQFNQSLEDAQRTYTNSFNQSITDE